MAGVIGADPIVSTPSGEGSRGVSGPSEPEDRDDRSRDGHRDERTLPPATAEVAIGGRVEEVPIRLDAAHGTGGEEPRQSPPADRPQPGERPCRLGVGGLLPAQSRDQLLLETHRDRREGAEKGRQDLHCLDGSHRAIVSRDRGSCDQVRGRPYPARTGYHPRMSNDSRVVILGGGFGGLAAARKLRRSGLDVVLIDRRNHHLFQPLLYQVATGGLSPANIAAPLRALLRSNPRATVLQADVRDLDLDRRLVRLADRDVPYGSLIVATGSTQSWFGNDAWAERAPGLKSLEDARKIRVRVLSAFERAELEEDEDRRRELLTFVVVGAGPTGVELAGAVAEVSRRTLRGEFRRIDPASARVVLLEGAPRVLPPFSETSSARATRDLEELGVTVRCGWLVREISGTRLRIGDGDGNEEEIDAETVLWAAGVAASPLGQRVVDQSEADTDRGGRVIVEPDCSVAGRPEVFVIGDLAHHAHGDDDTPLPGLAPVAMQQGRYVADLLTRRAKGRPAPGPFRYLDKGSMATIGRRRAVAEIGRVRIGGLPAWLAWLFIHLMYLAEFENRVLVLVQWGWNYFTRNRSARLITQEAGEDPGRLPPGVADS